MDFAVPVGHRMKMKEREKVEKSLDFTKGDCGTNCSLSTWNWVQRSGKENGGTRD